MSRKPNIRQEFYEVTILRDRVTGVAVRETWQVDRGPPLLSVGDAELILHRSGAPAVTVRDVQTGKVVMESWYHGGLCQRTDGPAEIRRDANTGVVVKESWRIQGRLHRYGGPAMIYRDSQTGEITRRRWFYDGKPMEKCLRMKMQRESSDEPVP